MKTFAQRNIVIDANLAQSSGHSADHTSIRSRSFLEYIRDYGHQIVLSPDITREWESHFSEFSSEWLADMINRGNVFYLGNVLDSEMRVRLKDTANDNFIWNILIEDFHLLEAALNADSTVASNDRRALRHYRRSCPNLTEICHIMWVNPVVESDACKGWLRRGAPVETERQLGYQHREH